MKFLIDAGLPPWMVDAFAANGHDAVYAGEIGLGRASDPAIAVEAQRQSLCVVTRDFDFGDIRTYVPRNSPGLIVLTIPRDRGSAYMRILLETLFEHLRQGRAVAGKLLIVEPGRIRVRD